MRMPRGDRGRCNAESSAHRVATTASAKGGACHNMNWKLCRPLHFATRSQVASFNAPTIGTIVFRGRAWGNGEGRQPQALGLDC